MDEHMRRVSGMMNDHDGFQHAIRHVCKTEWAYELSFVFKDLESFKAWKESDLRENVHSTYLDALKDVGIEEDAVYGGARVHDIL